MPYPANILDTLRTFDILNARITPSTLDTLHTMNSLFSSWLPSFLPPFARRARAAARSLHTLETLDALSTLTTMNTPSALDIAKTQGTQDILDTSLL